MSLAAMTVGDNAHSKLDDLPAEDGMGASCARSASNDGRVAGTGEVAVARGGGCQRWSQVDEAGVTVLVPPRYIIGTHESVAAVSATFAWTTWSTAGTATNDQERKQSEKPNVHGLDDNRRKRFLHPNCEVDGRCQIACCCLPASTSVGGMTDGRAKQPLKASATAEVGLTFGAFGDRHFEGAEGK